MTATPLSSETVQTDDYFGKAIYSYSLRTGINDGFLAPYRVRRVLMGPKQQQQHAGETEVVHAEDDDRQVITDPIIEESSATLEGRTELIAQHLATYLRQSDPRAKTIVFCVDQNHAEKMRKALEQACAEYVMRYQGYVERIVSEEGDDGKRALGRFSTPDQPTPVIVTTSRLLSTGVDVPTCKNIVLARPVGSLVEFKQIILQGHTDGVTGCAVSAAGDFIVSASEDQTLKVWDARSGVCLATLLVDGSLHACAFHPDGEHVVAAGAGGVYFLRLVR